MAFSDVVADIYGASIGDFVAERRRKAHTSNDEIARYGSGEPVRLRAATYGISKLIQSTWIGGVLEVAPGLAVWHSGYFRANRGLPITNASFRAHHLRAVKERESWFITPTHVILVGDLEGRRVEFALLIEEMALLLDALGAKHLLD